MLGTERNAVMAAATVASVNIVTTVKWLRTHPGHYDQPDELARLLHRGLPTLMLRVGSVLAAGNVRAFEAGPAT